MSPVSKLIFALFLMTFAMTYAKPTIYKRNQDNVFEPVMVPVSSTVIPLTMYKGEYDSRFISKNKKAQSLKPEDGAKLITMKKSQEKKT
ncbi:uncharacterized protein LOC128888796 [Hylaeus anthracinus]|uniref:uncharacterized protein LOC128888796 n=1 Tax=Hylaeus anthracinus TaxID=313031 RepID=UPI0023B9D174|nr:uncharacterized protein LOC128888796 [Hylaeus anthracinus]